MFLEVCVREKERHSAPLTPASSHPLAPNVPFLYIWGLIGRASLSNLPFLLITVTKEGLLLIEVK